jgi:hypothetical protein
MVDEGRATRLLRGIAEPVDRLARASDHRNTDSESLWLDGVKYLFVTAIEGGVDLAHHIIRPNRGAPRHQRCGDTPTWCSRSRLVGDSRERLESRWLSEHLGAPVRES